MTTNDECITAYEGVRARMTALVQDLDDTALATMVPAAPDWQVRDLIAHVVGVTADVAAGNVEDAGSDPWTAVQVEQRRGRTLAELLAEWGANTPEFTGVLGTLEPFRAGQIVFDTTTHEHDLRGALHQPGARDSDGFELGWTWATSVVGQMRDGYAAGALRLRTEAGELVVGAGDPTGTVAADRFELWRAMTGRRSAEQVERFDWEGEPAVAHLCLLPPRSTPLTE